ncbi:MAG: hypothetical protein KGL39_54845 [Patescibacteria group bacterium]|nr:hypothetical protein [Patescibacteria group bacterium]
MMAEPLKITKLDEMSMRTASVRTGAGSIRITAMTVRALRKELAQADQDAIVAYTFEIGGAVAIGPVAGLAFGSEAETVMLVGPEVGHALKARSEGNQKT